jgi:hypothetical protein
LFDFEPSRAGDKFTALEFRFDGYHLGYTSVSPIGTLRDTVVSTPRAGCTTCRAAEVTPPITVSDLGAPHSYSPWQSLAPRFWQPLITIASGTGNVIGATTSGEDVVGRHAYDARAGYNTKYREAELFGSYVYAGLASPSLARALSRLSITSTS